MFFCSFTLGFEALLVLGGDGMYQVDQEKCIGCAKCVEVCGFGAIRLQGKGKEKKAFIDPGVCRGCGTCVQVCPVEAISLVSFGDAVPWVWRAGPPQRWSSFWGHEGMGALSNVPSPWPKRGGVVGSPGGGRGIGRGRDRGVGRKRGPGGGMGRGRGRRRGW